MITVPFRSSRLAVAAIFSFALLAVATLAYAADTTLTATQTVPNATTGANTQAVSTTTVTANVAEVKATRTLAVGSAPTDGQNFTIGTCVVTFATTTGAALDTNCAGGATIRTASSTQVPYTAAEIAATLRTLTGVTDTGHGALTVSGSGTNVTFTTTGTETSATAITYSAGTASGITSGSSVTGTVPVAQVTRITPSNVEVGDTFSTVINGTTINYVAASSTVADVTAGLTAAINANGTVGSVVTAADTGSVVNVTSDTAGTAFTLTAAAANRVATAQTVTFTPENLGNTATFTITLNGVDYSARESGSATLQQLVETLNSQLTAVPGITCSEDDTKVTCVSNTPGTAFTYGASVTDIESASKSSGGGSHRSGGSSSRSVSTGTAAVTTTVVTTATTEPVAATASSSVTAFPDMTVGATGANVMTLQTWLMAKGFSIPAGATGYFGAQTKAALAAYQAANMITPAAGYFGPITRAYIAAH